ncbi:hypothetical protein [Paraburkholderia sp. BCC1886]|uniref:hypothetical protein n=1 Tax=Paraburkholderia sp. BCC1886 TaxID=2562670 RepID=UPI0011823D31|nr:hypothetical protein [Paraburkholderia sp. BCC1886]
MNTQTVSADRELLALEGEIGTLLAVRSQMLAQGFTTHLALEADQHLGGSQYASLAFSGKTRSVKLQIAIEGITTTVWDGIKKMFRKLSELIKRFVAWFKGDGKKFDAAHLQGVDAAAKAVSDRILQLDRIIKSPELRMRFEETLNSELSGTMPQSVRAMLDANSKYSEAMTALSGAFDQGDYLQIVEKGVAEVIAWFNSHQSKAQTMDATTETSHNDLEGFAKSIQSMGGAAETAENPLPARGAGQSLQLTKSRYEALKEAKTSISSGQYAAVPREIGGLLKVVLEAQGRIKITAAANVMRTAQNTLADMQKHLDTINQSAERLAGEAGDGKHHGAQIALTHAYSAHLRELISQFHTVLSAHDFLYEVWIETQKESLKIWTQIFKIYDSVVPDEAMSDAARTDRAEIEKQAKASLKVFASAI